LAETPQESRVTHPKIWQWLVVSAAGLLSGAVLAGDLPPPLSPEVSDVATLPPSTPHRFVTVGRSGSVIFDGDTGKIQGSIPSGYIANVAIAPDDSRFYVSETYWTHGARGTRDDLLTIYDGKTLNLIKEIPLPGRALVGKVQNFDLNAAGTRAYVYLLSPAGAVTWVDLKKQKVGGTVEVPGCALVFPWGDTGFSSLCGDGSLASVVVPESGKPTVTHTQPFFDANADPIFDAGFVDRATGTAIFISYTGLIYQAKLGLDTVVGKPWSIEAAAGYPVAGTGVQELAWRPGGSQLAAYHKATGKLFVLMHPGNYWTHKQGGTEVWVLDTKSHALVSRFPLRASPTSGRGDDAVPFYANLAVSQDDKPLLYLVNPTGGDLVLDATSGAEIRKIDAASGRFISVPGY
jgi:methylamine dehydrogenase heavy chain